ncbi:MAG: VWA domain-containing protein [Bacteroidota bacterium]
MTLPKILPFALMALLLLAAGACNKDDDSPTSGNKENLVIRIQEQYETPPSRVSVFFKVETGSGEPVAGLTEPNFTIYEKGRNDEVERLLSEDETTRILSDNGQIFRYHNILVLDLSGSVLNNNLEQLKDAAKSFISDVMATDFNSSASVGIWWFDGRDQLHQLIDFTDDESDLYEAVDGITPSISSDSSTDLFGAILKSTDLAEAKLSENQAQGILSAVSIIVFTDGTDQAARYAKADAYQAVDNASEGINFYTIGLGDEIDETALRKIGTSSFVFADDTTVLNNKFVEIANLISAEANSYYLFEYCTPKRNGSGESELHINVENDTGKGKRVTTFSADGFEDDCDLN